MGLSAEESKQKITTYQMIFDIVTAIKELAANPDIDELSKNAYALPERDQAKANEARQLIATYDAKIAESKKLALMNEEVQDNIDERKAQLQAAQIAIDKGNKDLDARKAALDEVADIQSRVSKELKQKEQELEAGNSKLEAGKAELEIKKAEVAEYEAKLKEKADALKSLTQGM